MGKPPGRTTPVYSESAAQGVPQSGSPCYVGRMDEKTPRPGTGAGAKAPSNTADVQGQEKPGLNTTETCLEAAYQRVAAELS
ncbi:hypothetical protein [Corynebacterium phocae]|nr:hypothetical protein [Corynebacterium phocae]